MNSAFINKCRRKLVAWFVGVLLAALCLRASAQAGRGFQFQDGDRVVFVGDTLIEREQHYGRLEQRLTVREPGKNVTFRNLGWSADTPAGESRASFDFDKPGKGFDLLKEHIVSFQPTVVFVGYGMASSFDGEAGLPRFKQGMNHLLDTIESVCTNKNLRVVLLSPVRHENLGPPLPDPAEHNRVLALYSQAIEELAAQRQTAGNGSGRKYSYISLQDIWAADGAKAGAARAGTDDGIHLTDYGYSRLTDTIEKGLGWTPNRWRVEITADGKIGEGSRGATVTGLEHARDHVRFTSLEEELVNPASEEKTTRVAADAPALLRIDGLKSGRYELTVDGANVATASAGEWARGVEVARGPQWEQAGQLRHAILRKNELVFNRWRPQNETYLFGFRKSEQGQNAKEIPMFDPLITEQETKIAELRRPVAHVFELSPAGKKPAAFVASPESGVPSDLGFDIAPGFEISLYAESPLLAKPIQMNFDPRGRLWVVSSEVYPQIKPGQEANDKVLVLEDTKGAGRADKSTVFADGLLIPTGVEPGDGGVYVGQSTELLFFKDTNGDGRADVKRVVLSGFGTEDTHHIIHTLDWGYDGTLYFDQSIYIHSHLETPNGVVRLNSGGVLSLRPSTMELSVYLRGFVNPWGHQFDAFGQSFLTDGAGSQGINYGIPGATFTAYAGLRRELKSVSPGDYPKFCALELIYSKQFPDDWQGNAITCDFRAHRVVRFAIDESGGGYVTHELADLLRTTNMTFRPIDVKLGPDGALYIADWSNPIIQHGEVDFRDPRRDHEHGRIWRVTAKGRPLLKRFDFVKASDRELLDELLSPNKYDQQQARRVLTERGAAIEPALAKWVRRQKDDQALLQGLWMYQSINVVEPKLLERVLNAGDGRVRAAATRVVGAWHSRLAGSGGVDPVELLARRLNDDHQRVRIEAMRALGQIPTPKSAELVLAATDKPMDRFVDYAAWLSINDLAQPWLEAVKSGAWNSQGRERELEFGLEAIEPELAGTVLDQALRDRKLPRDGSGPWIDLIAKSGGPASLRRLFDQVLQGGFDEEPGEQALQALGRAARLRSTNPSGDLASLATLFVNSSEKIRRAAVELAGYWKLDSAIPGLASLGNGKEKPELAEAACASLRAIGGDKAIAALQPMTDKTNAPAIRRAAVVALAGLDMDKARQPAVDVLIDTGGENDALELWRSLLKIKDAAKALTQDLPKTGLPAVMAKAGLRAAREGGKSEPDLVFALSRGAGLDDTDSATSGLSDAEIKALLGSVHDQGDAARGEQIFRRKDCACATCHSIGGVGGKVGPDLTSIGASSPVDYLIESVLYPSRKIKEGYHAVMVETTDGEELSGVLAREDGEQLVLRDASDKEISIAKKSIKSRVMGKNSLMPNGLVDPLNSGERLDLYRFLSELGKPGPYDASKGGVARLWRVQPLPADSAASPETNIVNQPLTNSVWTPLRSFVDGRLPAADIKECLLPAGDRAPEAVLAAVELQVPKSGPVELKWSGTTDCPMWIDGKTIDHAAKLELADGIHTIVVKLDAKHLPDALRLECPDGTFLTN